MLELLAVSGNVEARRLPRNRTQLEDDRPYVEEARDDGGLAHIAGDEPGTAQVVAQARDR